MQTLILLLALSIPQDGHDAPAPATVSVADCAVQRLKPFVSPYGIRQAWPVMASPPPELMQTLGTPLADMGHIADGYQQFLHIDRQARAVYVVEQGGFAGTTKVYGPLPLPRCAPAAETPPG
jgi:hypothetical protein